MLVAGMLVRPPEGSATHQHGAADDHDADACDDAGTVDPALDLPPSLKNGFDMISPSDMGLILQNAKAKEDVQKLIMQTMRDCPILAGPLNQMLNMFQ